jgi:RND superfamily putative drug exporter
VTRLLSRIATQRPRRVLAVAGVALAIAVAFGAPVTGMLRSGSTDFQDPASQFERTNAAIESATKQTALYNLVVLLRGTRQIRLDQAAQTATSTVAGLVAAQPGFQRLADYPPSHSPALISRDGRQTVVLAAFTGDREANAAITHVRAALARPASKAKLAGVSVRFGGYAPLSRELNRRTTEELARTELLALPLLLALSFWFFRGVVAALLPPLVGGLAILLTFLALRAVDQFAPLSVFALNLVSGMGLGLGIDYSLFVLSRYREELAGGADPQAAIGRTLATAGRTVLFSSVTVAAAMTSLLVFPLRFLYSMGIGGAVVTLCDGAVALLVLPALLVVLGPRVDALSPAWLQRRAARSARATHEGGWWRLAHGVVSHPLPVATLVAIALLIAASPALGVRFVSPGGDLLPASAESRQVETALRRGFALNVGEATEVVVKGSRAAARRLALAARETAGPLASGVAPVPLGHGTWKITLLPHGSPVSAAQQRLLSRLRAVARPYGALVGGASAYYADQKAAIAARIPLALIVLLPLTAGFLFLMTGSVVIPVKALAMNALSVAVAVGLQVAIFQDGHLSGLLGFTPIGGLEESTLVLMLVLAFALATDYEVFVIARVKEAYDDGLPNREAIALGVERTGRLVTAAALLFCVAIGAFTLSDLFFTKQLGLGAALAVAVDASVVRALLVPALMAMMGRWNWWAPAPLRRLHRRIGLRESTPVEA